jgi:DNA recombination-dependent growth factor C
MTDEVKQFIKTNRVEVLFDSSLQYLCYINNAAYGLGDDLLEALENGIERYLSHPSDEEVK